jgi:hypothetical protein
VTTGAALPRYPGLPSLILDHVERGGLEAVNELLVADVLTTDVLSRGLSDNGTVVVVKVHRGAPLATLAVPMSLAAGR